MIKVLLEIPDEFIDDFNKDKFEDCLQRLKADAHSLAGNYEKETADMLIKAFKESKYNNREKPVNMSIDEAINILELNNPFMGGFDKEELSMAMDLAVETMKGLDMQTIKAEPKKEYKKEIEW